MTRRPPSERRNPTRGDRRPRPAASPAAIALVIATLLSQATPVSAQDTSPPTTPAEPAPTAEPATGIDAFSIVWSRNIFDPARRSPAEQERERREPPPRPPRTEWLRLTGTMVHNDKAWTFWNASSRSMPSVVALGDPVADFTVDTIEPGLVHLRRNDEKLPLHVGNQLTRTGDEPWQISSDRSDRFRTPPAGSDESPDSTRPTDSPSEAKPDGSSDDSGPSDILKRLMEKRRQQLNQ